MKLTKKKLKKNIMVTRNWIKEIIEFVRNAMNEGLDIYSGEYNNNYQIRIIRNHSLNETFDFIIYKDYISISSPTGFIKIENTLSERDELEIKASMLSIKEYKEDMAISEFEHFFKTDDEPKTVNDLDDDDE